MTRKLHLSKTKHSKFNESGQLLCFFVLSLLWAGEIVRREGILWSISRLWTDYPGRHLELPYILKYYNIVQIAYWLHCYPELYFQKIKRDEMPARTTYATLYLFFIAGAYVLK